MLEIKGFIESIGMYNEGNADYEGKWVTFPIDEDEEKEVMHEIGCDIPGYEEYFFTDWECEIDLHFGEYENISSINEIAEYLQESERYNDDDLINAVLELVGNSEPITDIDFENFTLLIDVFDDYDLGYYWIEESGCYDLSKLGNLSNYIDYEKFGRDISLEEYGTFTEWGYVYGC